MTEPLVRRTDHNRVAVIELNRPERKNALIGPMFDELTAHVKSAGVDRNVGAVLLCGAGGAFCSGLDLTAYNADPPPTWLATASDSARSAHVALGACPHPVVVSLERYAINGGAAFALAGDLIVAGRDSWLQVGEVRLGMNAPMNLAWLVARYSPRPSCRSCSSATGSSDRICTASGSPTRSSTTPMSGAEPWNSPNRWPASRPGRHIA